MKTRMKKSWHRLGAMLLSLCLIIGLMPVNAFAEDAPTKRDTYNVYAENVINGGSDSQVYAVTIENVDGEDLHYVYSPNAIHSKDLMEKLRAGLEEPYKSLIPTFEGEDSNRGFLCFSRDQEKYEAMTLDWDDPKAVADALISGSGSVSVAANDSAISVTDISVTHANEKVVTEDQYYSESFYTDPPELGQLASGKNRVESCIGISYKVEKVEDKEYYDVFNNMHASQIYAYTATKAASESNSIDLPVRVLDEGDVDYSPAPELSATFTPNIAVTAGEFNQWQGLAIDYYNPMVETEWYEPVSEGYDIQTEYTVSIPLTDYEGETISGVLTVPLPEGYDGATARIKGGAKASSYTKDTVSFPVTLDVSGGSADLFGVLIEYREAQEPADQKTPVIIKGAGGTWQKGSKDGLSFTSNAEFADFIKVQVDGKDLDASDYTLKEGSTIVTLNGDYLNTLSVGKHTLVIVSTTGTATTEFTVTDAQSRVNDQSGSTASQDTDGDDKTTTSPKTGDKNDIMMWIALLFVSGGVFAITFYNRKSRE